MSIRLKDVPVGAIKIPLLDIQQVDGYSCGAVALRSICCYYNVGPARLATYRHKLHTSRREGTYYLRLRNYARELGLKADVLIEMSVDDLKSYLDQGIPVICSIQAYGGPKADYTKNNEGHYVVAIGYDERGGFYFMDSSANYEGARASPRYSYLPEKEFVKRWHEDEGVRGKHEPYERLGIVIRPDPKKGSPLLQAREIE